MNPFPIPSPPYLDVVLFVLGVTKQQHKLRNVFLRCLLTPFQLLLLCLLEAMGASWSSSFGDGDGNAILIMSLTISHRMFPCCEWDTAHVRSLVIWLIRSLKSALASFFIMVASSCGSWFISHLRSASTPSKSSVVVLKVMVSSISASGVSPNDAAFSVSSDVLS